MSLPLLTVFTDASWCPRTRVGGWAAWAKREDMGTFFKAASFKVTLPGSIEAECAAISNAVTLLHRANFLGGDHHVLIKLDCRAVIDHIGRFVDKSSDLLDPYAVQLREAAERVRCLELRYVEGHCAYDTPRHHVNNRCDRAAYAAMMEARRIIESGASL